MNWRLELYDLALVGILYMGAEFLRTQSEPVTSWESWARAVGMGVAYKVVPQLLTLLGTIRVRLAKPKP